jgi:chromosome segregation ATPase
VSAASDPVDFPRRPEKPEISPAAQQAREQLHEEIERIRLGVEEMINEDSGGSDEIRRELEELRVETRNYVKRKVRKSEKRLERSLREMDARTDQLERRVDEVEQGREQAEWRIHANTEAMLDGLLREVRVIADRLTKQPKR